MSVAVGRARPSRRGAPRARLVEIQRARLLSAALRAVDELGYAGTTVAHVTSRARVSRRTFYELYANREECLLAALESVVEQLREELAVLNLDVLPWRERVRTGLWAILSFFDREPLLARVCVVQALRGGPRVLESRERVLGELAEVINTGCGERARVTECPPLTAEGLVGAVFSIVYARLSSSGWGGASRSRTQEAWRAGRNGDASEASVSRLRYASDRGRRDAPPIAALHGELMGMIVLPYMGPAAARREQDRPAPVLNIAHASGPDAAGSMSERERGGDVLAGLPMRLTYRTARVLETIAERSGVSNRQAGELAGVSDQGQISKLLARLERLGLIENTGVGHAKGERNAWALTTTGAQVARSIRAHTPEPEGAES